MSCPDLILSVLIKSCIKLKLSLNFFGFVIVGASDPTLFWVCAKEDPPNLNSSNDKLI